MWFKKAKLDITTQDPYSSSCDIFCFINLIFFSANVNRKTFKPSVKPGWYYFGRKMVRTHLRAYQRSQKCS